MDEDSKLAEQYFYEDLSELPKRSPPKIQRLSKKPAESSKIKKKPLLVQFFSNMKSSWSIFYEINPNLSISKSSFISRF